MNDTTAVIHGVARIDPDATARLPALVDHACKIKEMDDDMRICIYSLEVRQPRGSPHGKRAG